ncbi:hypothetical protein SAMN04488109_4612 [Chryseolinea serpens]|uniref:Uncharacterized protein n=1 Tax=Chryseolinea serpens TaxID=947013 RepID=A0A1M5UDJ1_9BACT|nr:hypothetical protein [Chryseolinea serpens]SHH61029.1 hypothetical protein SAMN04488109_4612 [Chryseolinea serpens]
MRLFLLIFTALFVPSPGDMLTNNNLFLPSTANALPGEGVVILNSYPKAGRYTDSEGHEFGYGITRTTLINVSENPLQLTINFPADSFAFSTLSGSYVKLFLPPDTISFNDMPFDNSSWYVDDDLRPFLNTGLHTPTALQETISPNHERVFYIGALYQKTAGVPRAELVLKDHNLFFRPSRLDSLLIPCGEIIFKK